MVIALTPLDLGLASVLVLILAAVSWRLHLGVSSQLVIAAVRTTVQLLLVGLVLRALFANAGFGWVSIIAVVMLLAAGREVLARQQRKLAGAWGYGIGVSAMFVSTFVITFFALTVVINADPWYTPQYAIPLLGMMLGNTMNGIALSMDRLLQNCWQQRNTIEARLLMGQPGYVAIDNIRRESMRTGMMPMINAMAAAGIVSLPGMMTGQILSGTDPFEAVKYQILIMFMITGGAGFGTLVAIQLTSYRLFDQRQRLRLDHLVHNGSS